MIQNLLSVYRLKWLSTLFGALNCGPTSINNAVDSCRWSGQPLQSTFACDYLAQRLHAASKTILLEMAKINRLLLLACHKTVTLDFTFFIHECCICTRTCCGCVSNLLVIKPYSNWKYTSQFKLKQK